MKARLLICLAALFPLILAGQSLQTDQVFFQAQTRSYDRWLTQEGLGEYLSVYALDVKESRLSLYLQFPFKIADDSARLDQAVATWKLVKTYYDSLHTDSIESALLYKLSFLMEVGIDSVEILLYDTHDLGYDAQFMRFIYYWQDSLRVRRKGQMKAKTVPIKLKAPTGNGREEEKIDLGEVYSKARVFAGIQAYCEQRFNNERCEGRKAHIELIDDEEVLQFQVWNLCREVLYYMDKSNLCSFVNLLGFECDWAKREMLEFRITYLAQPDGIELILIVDGKIGSGLYEEDRRGGYYNMEDDFDDAFGTYAQSFKKDLREYLKDYLR